jgi:hypothetical protein
MKIAKLSRKKITRTGNRQNCPKHGKIKNLSKGAKKFCQSIPEMFLNNFFRLAYDLSLDWDLSKARWGLLRPATP